MCKLIIEYQKTKSDKTYTQIFNKYYPDLKSFLSSQFSYANTQVIEDIAIMSFEQARTKIDSYDPERNFKTWFYTISKRLGLRIIDKERIYQSACFENGDSDEEKNQSNNLAKRLLEQTNPHEEDSNPLLSKIRVGNREEDPLLSAYDSVLSEINNLKGDVRDIVIDSYLNNMTFEKIMKKYNLSESQVKLKLFTGRKDIRKVFHEKKVEDIKMMMKVESLKIPEVMNEMIQKKLKYCGELIVSKRGRGYNYKYTFANTKVNLKAICNHVSTHNKKVNEEISNYTEFVNIQEDPSYAKKYFNKQVRELKEEGFAINKEEIKKAEDLGYAVSVKGIKTRNRSGNSKSNQKLMKVEKLKMIEPRKLQQLTVKESKSEYLSLKVVEKGNIIKIDVK
jgi:RNA polymerase sigma factor (sigma-70 family)